MEEGLNKNEFCSLCKLVFDRDIKTSLYFENDSYMVVDCLTCYVPMLVLKEHRKEFTGEERVELTIILKGLFIGLRKIMPEQYLDFEMKSIPDHAHVHVRDIE